MSISRPAYKLTDDKMTHELILIINRFRIELERFIHIEDTSLKSFPRGCCKPTSFILRQYLEDSHGIKNIMYVWGTNAEDNTHGWLEINDVIIDLTADQFSENYPKVMIVNSQESNFHKSFKRQLRFPNDFAQDHPLMEVKNKLADIMNSKPL